ncbi:MAG: FkbM family methyltransferase [Atribacterota bacterium]|nr:FkbM family methyltransferase [Atribacterota bacterium]
MTDEKTCWYQDSCCDEMNAFYDKEIKGKAPYPHIEVFKSLIGLIDDEKGKNLLDIGCGTAMISEYCTNFLYFGTDLAHVIIKCAMRNYPDYFYRKCDITSDPMTWIDTYKVIVMNGFIDIMQEPIVILDKVLANAQKYVIIHRQEITESGETRVIQNGSYGGYTYHSIINRDEFNTLLDMHNFSVVKELPCGFSNWENDGSSFLLKKKKSWALNLIDHKLNKYFIGKENGFFIDAGANDGLTQSNTMFFEFYKNWTGILIEPIPELVDKCLENRSPRSHTASCALVSPDYHEGLIDMIYTPDCNGLLSVIDNPTGHYLLKRDQHGRKVNIKVNAYTLDAVLNLLCKPSQKIDLLSMDIEGHEIHALKGISFDKWNIDYILVEELEENDNILNILSPYYDRLGRITPQDILYKRKS